MSCVQGSQVLNSQVCLCLLHQLQQLAGVAGTFLWLVSHSWSVQLVPVTDLVSHPVCHLQLAHMRLGVWEPVFLIKCMLYGLFDKS
jgi:hypothetical protein